MDDELQKLRKQVEELTELFHLQSQRAMDYAGMAMRKREWVGLTDEEIREFEIWLDDEEEKRGWNPPADIVKYIEAKLREKNNG